MDFEYIYITSLKNTLKYFEDQNYEMEGFDELKVNQNKFTYEMKEYLRNSTMNYNEYIKYTTEEIPEFINKKNQLGLNIYIYNEKDETTKSNGKIIKNIITKQKKLYKNLIHHCKMIYNIEIPYHPANAGIGLEYKQDTISIKSTKSSNSTKSSRSYKVKRSDSNNITKNITNITQIIKKSFHKKSEFNTQIINNNDDEKS